LCTSPLTAPPPPYSSPLSLHDALPICLPALAVPDRRAHQRALRQRRQREPEDDSAKRAGDDSPYPDPQDRLLGPHTLGDIVDEEQRQRGEGEGDAERPERVRPDRAEGAPEDPLERDLAPSPVLARRRRRHAPSFHDFPGEADGG